MVFRVLIMGFQPIHSHALFNTGTIGTIIGAPPNTTIGPDGSNISFLSTSTPQGSPVNSLIMRCDIISNPCINPDDIDRKSVV